jgi:lipopolysaccharide/colanic/teichoic acid biosynthesis glycosyltransferase
MKGVLFFNISKIYENIFDRIPVSMSGQTWFIEHMSSMAPKMVYDGIKRLIDIVASIILGLISLIFYPIVIVLMKIEDEKAPIFSYQKRVGQYNKIINIVKFRTMTIANDDGKWGKGENKVTKVGNILRITRIDELPQLWNVLKGDISLIGPRPEFPDPVAQYSKEDLLSIVLHIISLNNDPAGFGTPNIKKPIPVRIPCIRPTTKLPPTIEYIACSSFLKILSSLVSPNGLRAITCLFNSLPSLKK